MRNGEFRALAHEDQLRPRERRVLYPFHRPASGPGTGQHSVWCASGVQTMVVMVRKDVKITDLEVRDASTLLLADRIAQARPPREN
jgi:hypothetical protein